MFLLLDIRIDISAKMSYHLGSNDYVNAYRICLDILGLVFFWHIQ